MSSEKATALTSHDWREDPDLLQAIVDNCTAVIYLKDCEGRYLFINRQFEALFHVNRRDVVGKTDYDLFPSENAATFRANDLKVLRAGKPMEWEEDAPHDDGPHRYISLKFPMRTAAGEIYGLCGISSDISPLKRMQEERDRFFNLTLDLLCVANFDGYFVRLNPSWQRVLGWSVDELLARPYYEFLHPDDRSATLAIAENVNRGVELLSFENRYRCRDGTYKWLLWNAMPDLEQRLVYGAAHDITARKQLEKQLTDNAAELEQAIASERAAHQQLKKAQTQLVQAEKMVTLGQIVAGVAHELNNPLTFVSTNMAVLERDVPALQELLDRYRQAERSLGPEQNPAFEGARNYAAGIDADYTLESLRGILARTREGLRRMEVIVRDLRDFARGSDRDWHEVDLNAGIESTVNILQIKADKKHVHLERQLGTLPRLRCQPAKINQVVLNLTANAIDAAPEGGRVVIRSRVVDRHVEIAVEDNGPGIDPSIMSKIFEPFFTTKAPGAGTGLGLSISSSIMEDHGGRIDVESAPGAGSVFRIVLPIRGKGSD